MRNTILIHGRLGRDIEGVASGKLFKSVLAVSVKGREGEETHWYNLVFFGDLGTQSASRFNKGASIGVSGSPRINTYTGKDGVKRSSIEVYVDEVFPVEFKKRENKETSITGGMSTLKDALINIETSKSTFGLAPAFNEEDIPF